jgi:hypothetical protein
MSLLRPVTADELRRATIFQLTMTSPTDGWAVGGIYAPSNDPARRAGLILHYHEQQWWLVDDSLPVAILNSIAMVSPSDGWVTGSNLSRNGQRQVQSFVIRYTGDHWQPVEVPFQASERSYFGGIKMWSPDEGWLVVESTSSWEPPIWSLLLHFQRGTWTQVVVPIPTVWDFAPVGPDELWIVGNPSTLHRQDSMLAHYHQGQWTTMSAPDHVLLRTLYMLSATAGYAIGQQPEPRGRGIWPRDPDPPAAVLQYDGSTWSPIEIGADRQAQEIMMFDEGDLWAFVRTPTPPPPFRANDMVSAAQHSVGRRVGSGGSGVRWELQAVDVSFSDLIRIGPAMARAAPGEYWARADYVVPPKRHENFHLGLLHFVDGAWQQYQPG